MIFTFIFVRIRHFYFTRSVVWDEIAPIVAGSLMGLDAGHEIERHLRMMVLVRPSATHLRHLLTAFSMAQLPQSSRKRQANAFVPMKYRGSWFCTDDRGYVSGHFFNAAYDQVNMVVDPLGWPYASDPDGASEIAPAVCVGFGLASPDPSPSSKYEHNPK
jgi:hypothetical protein